MEKATDERTKYFGGILFEQRSKKGLALSDVERMSGYAASNLSKIERGLINPMSKKVLTERVLPALGIYPSSPDYDKILSLHSEKVRCKHCDFKFSTNRTYKDFCSEKCRNRYHYDRNKVKYTGKLFYANYKAPLKEVKNGYGFYGTIAADETGNLIQCHACGDLYKNLASHARHSHKLSAKEYRDKYELSSKTALVGEEVRERAIALQEGITPEERLRRVAKARESRKTPHKQSRNPWSLERKNRAGNCPDQLVHKVQSLGDKLGKTPTVDEFCAEYGAGMFSSVKTTFGNWNNAVEIAGLNLNKRRPYGKEELLAMLKNFYQQHRRSPSSSDMRRGLLPNDLHFRRFFRDLNEARVEAGIPTITRGEQV